MHRRTAPSLLAAILVAGPAPAATGAGASARAPTTAEIRAAVGRAEHSRELWATVNICNTARHPDIVGVRGQMPSLGFTSRLYMEIRVEYRSGAAGRFALVPRGGDSGLLALGRAEHGARQAGATFPFRPPSAGVRYVLRAAVTFEWKLAGRLIAKAVRTTGHGDAKVAYGDPPGFSAATCTIS